jgi:DNA-binding CsgD family transcriptional regulator
MRKFQRTEEFKAALITLLKTGKTNKEIGDLYGVSHKTITKWIKMIGVSSKDSRRRRNPFHSGDERKIIEMYEQGKTTGEIAKSFSTNVSTLIEFQKEHNIKASDYFEHRINFNVHAFNKIDTEEKAYWLGFLYADGCIDSNRNRVFLDLKDVDRDHVLKFKTFLKDTRDESIIKTITIKLPSGNITCHSRYCVSSKTLKEDLIKLGCFPRKSLSLTFPNLSLFDRESLVFDFLRGYVDGDGCLYKTRSSVGIEILGTESFLDGITKYLPEFRKPSKISHSKVFRIGCYGKNASEVANKLYGHATIYLDRKYEKFKEYFEHKDGEVNNNGE